MANKKITDKYDAYEHFLDSLISNLERATAEYDKRTKLYTVIKEMLRKKKNGQLVQSTEYAALAEISCPEVDLLELFNGQAEFEEEGFVIPDLDKLLWMCPMTSCTTCWQNFINTIAESINRSNVLIKNLQPLDDNVPGFVINGSSDDYLSIEELAELYKSRISEGGSDNGSN